MTFRPVGLLLDTVYDNTGDKAIRLVMEDLFRRWGVAYEVANPLNFNAADYDQLVIGGGQLIRPRDGAYYDVFQVPGPHILNAVGVLSGTDVEYLREYRYVAVRSTADRQRLGSAVEDVAVVPCVSLLLKGAELEFAVKTGSVGVHLSPDAIAPCHGVEGVLSSFSELKKLFIPFTHQWNDEIRLATLADSTSGGELAPYLQPDELFTMIGRLDYFVGSSLHACMFAYANNVPFLAFNRPDSKIAEFMSDRNLEEWLFNDAQELGAKLQRLITSPQDYSARLARDRQKVLEHVERIRSLIGRRTVFVGKAPSDGRPDQSDDVLTYVRTLQEAIRRRDFEVARRTTQQGIALAGRDAAIDAAIAERDRIILARDSELAEKDSVLASKSTALDQKDAHIANIETALHQANVQAAAAQHQLNQITGSAGYRLLELVRRPVRWLAPQGTRQHFGVKVGARALNILVSEGPWTLVRRALPVWRWLPRLRRGIGVQQGATLDDQYQLWLKAHELTPARAQQIRKAAARLDYRPLVSIVMPVYNPDPAWLRDAIESVRAQLYDNWELCIADDASTRPGVRELLEESSRANERIKVTYLSKNQGIGGASNAALALATGEFVGLLDHDDELKPDALFEVAKLLNKRRGLDYIYSDEDKRDPDGRLVEPFFKPDWSPDFLMTLNYVTHFSVFRKAILDQVGGFRLDYDGSQDYDLVLRVTETTDKVAHIPKPLYTWRKVPGSAAGSTKAKSFAYRAGKRVMQDALARRGLQGSVTDGILEGRYRVKYKVVGDPKVAIIIPTRDRVDLLRGCVDSIARKSSYRNYEIIVVDNGSKEPETLDYLSSFGGKVIKYPQEFNFAKINNLAARATDADLLIFLNNDIEVISEEWIQAMLEHAQRPGVAAVGARLLYPDGRVQHEGIIMGLGGGSAGNVDHGGRFGLGQSIRNCSAVTAACMMTGSAVFWELGGFDESLRVAFNDVDFCLRAQQKGYRIVYTPYASLYHHESASRGRLHPKEDEKLFRERWGNPGEYRDPYYNPNLDLLLPFNIRL